ncbi:MAG TPA: anti-sigma factor [Chthoniobacterales bacterium]|nr:anti-sigma factor [Chthoniobacterales bacterium]
MSCEESIRLMDGYLDGELDPITNQTIEQHLRECHKCDHAYKTQAVLIRSIGNAAPYYKAPAGLRERIQSSLREEIADRPMPSLSPDAPSRLQSKQSEQRAVFLGTQWNWLALAAAIVLAAIVAFNLVPRLQRPGADQLLATQLIAGHVRSLMANHLTDVASSDQHTVKPWLDAKLDFAPAVVDLGNEGFPLLGGRLDYLANRPVAALVYQRRKHFINLFVWPKESGVTSGDEKITRQGYQLVHWVDSDFNYWAVSDVSNNDLQTFQQVFEKQRRQ